jgi:hypothetical protein
VTARNSDREAQRSHRAHLLRTTLARLRRSCERPPAGADGGFPGIGHTHPSAASPHARGREASHFARLHRAVRDYLRRDPTASFGFVDCEVDSFAARPKASVPGYALPVLESLGLGAEVRPLELIPAPVLAPKLGQDQDADLTRKLSFATEAPLNPLPAPDGEDDDAGDDTGAVIRELRTEPPIVLEPRPSNWVPPTQEELDAESNAALPILAAFLARNPEVFRFQVGEPSTIASTAATASLQQVDYTAGRYFRKAMIDQTLYGLPVLAGRILVLFDLNWNVIGISRTLLTPEKLPLPEGEPVPAAEAIGSALDAVVQATGRSRELWTEIDALLGIEPVRRRVVWRVQLRVPDPPESDLTVSVDAASGEVLNVDDNVLAFTDAKLRRWGYSGGDATAPVQIVSEGQYTRDDNTMTHDFF